MLVSKNFILKTLLLFVFSFSAIAENPFPPLAEDAITIDGNDSDWSGVEAFKDPFGLGKKGDSIDVKSLHAGFTQSHFVYKVVLDPDPGSFSPKETTSILQILYDPDANESTGSNSSQVYKIKPKGFHSRVELSINKNKEIIATLYSNDNDFNKKVKEWKNGSENLAVKGNIVELKVPYDIINFKPSSGLTPLRIYFAEFSNKDSKSGYVPLNLTLDYGSLKTAAVSKSSSSESGKKEGGFNIFHLMIITTWIVSILCGFAIAPKAGLSTGIAAVNLIPFLGQLIFFFILAFGQWPLHKDYQKLEDRLREFDDVI